MRILAAAVGFNVALASLLAACGHRPPPPLVTSEHRPPIIGSANQVVAGPVDPDPRVGAVFLGGGDLHACTGAVLHSASGNLVLTAAHCLVGGRVTFVPGFANQAAPGDVWTVDVVYLDPRWVTNQDPHADFAIVRVSRPEGGSVEARVGSALSLGSAPAKDTRVRVVAYPAGAGGMPIGCEANTAISTSGYPKLLCSGMADGTSGAPWISGSSVTGLIGGLHGGGCKENVSYSPPFDQHITDLLARAEAGGSGDVAPAAFDDDCS
jgi:Trypsin-like peptidase domain